ncbi:MAG: universal stress protein [Desulfuromonadales bacterium]|nr:universal stress protein [Desulfuromonadales bacterium]
MIKFNTILFATDFSENSDYAFDYALTMAKAFSTKLLIIHVINEPVDLQGFYVPHVTFDNLGKEIAEGAEKMLENFCNAKNMENVEYEKIVVSGVPGDEVIREAKERSADLIVLGTHGRTGLNRFLFGSTAEKVVRLAESPVMTIRKP